jgi:hypothetical protein
VEMIEHSGWIKKGEMLCAFEVAEFVLMLIFVSSAYVMGSRIGFLCL